MESPTEALSGADAARGFLEARRVALVGASGGTRDQWSFNARMTRSLLASSFEEVVVVSRHDREIGGQPAYESLQDYPGSAGDVCVLVVPRAGLREAVQGARASGWRRFVIITGQLNDEDRAELRDVLFGARLWGPNCTGLVVAATNSRLMASDYELRVRPGRRRIAVVGQSGGALGAIAKAVEDLGVNVSHLLSTGEEIDVGIEDVLSYAACSGTTDGVVLFVEEARRPELFLNAVAACQAAAVPVVIVKVGRSSQAEAAAWTHTGALVGDWDEFEVAVSSRGAVVCESLREAAGVAALWANLRRRPGRRTAFFTSSGGTEALACDVAETCGLPLAQISQSGSQRLRELAGFKVDGVNPFDSANGGGTPSTLPTYLETLATETDVDTVVLLHLGAVYGDFIVDQLASDREPRKPLVAVWPAAEPVLRDRMLDGGVPVVDDVADACRWLALAAGRSNGRGPFTSGAVQQGGTTSGSDDDESSWLPYEEAIALLEEGGVDVPRRVLVRSPGDAAVGLDAFDGGYPVVVKAARLRGHKGRVGGVVRDVATRAELTEVLRRLTSHFGEAVIEEQVPHGTEVLLAVRSGPFGGVIVAGFGGAYADVLGRQVVVRRDAPSADLRDRVLDSLVGRVLLSELGDGPGRRAVDALAGIAAKLAEIVAVHGLDSIEVNPVIVTEHRVVACDTKAQRASFPGEVGVGP